MSCLAGWVQAGVPSLAPELLGRMLSRMQPRAPDGRSEWLRPGVALGHLLLRTSARDEAPSWPLSLDGRHWIVADARLDAREDLLKALRQAGESIAANAPDAALILHAYRAWGASFPERLTGDFALALWDAEASRLICARDPFGIRPLFYAVCGDTLAFASTTGALRSMPWVGSNLDPVSQADFLMFGCPMDPDRSMFADIRCLPPGHCLRWDSGRIRQHAYWHLPDAEAPVGWRTADMAEQFLDVFQCAVRDRLPDGPVAAELSGGMDASSIVAVAARQAAHPLFAFTNDLSRLEPRDEEARLAVRIAQALGVDLHTTDQTRFPLFASLPPGQAAPDEPIAFPLLSAHADALGSAVQKGCRVMLCGTHGDAVLAADPDLMSRLWAKGRWGRLGLEALRHLCLTSGLRGLGLRQAWRGVPPAPELEPELPPWIRPGSVEGVDVAQRWRAGWEELNGSRAAAAQLRRTWDGRDSGVAGCLPLPLVHRFPFLDQRLLRLVARFPPGALNNKAVLRRAMRGLLPDWVRARPKTWAPGDYQHSFARAQALAHWAQQEHAVQDIGIDETAWRGEFARWVRNIAPESTWSSHLLMHPLALRWWIICADKE